MKALKDERIKVAEKELKKKEDKEARERSKRALKKAKAVEAVRVVERIKEVAREKAEKEVLEAEAIRESKEKLDSMKKVFDQEPIRNRVIAGGVLFFLVAIAIVGSVVTQAVVLGPVIVFIFMVTGAIFYKAYLLSFVKPTIVPESEIERRIELLGAERVKVALEEMKEKELKFKERERQEAIEYQQIKEQRRIQKELKQKEAMEIVRLEEIEHEKMMAAKAEEIKKKKMSKKDIVKDLEITTIDNNNTNINDNNNEDDNERYQDNNQIDPIPEHDNDSIGSIESADFGGRERRGSDVSTITTCSLDYQKLGNGKSFILLEKDENNNNKQTDDNDKNNNNDTKNDTNSVIIDVKPEEIQQEALLKV